jgi:hypothetical protein
MITNLEKYLIEALIGILIVLMIFCAGYYVEYKNFKTFKDEQSLLLKDRNAQITALNQTIKENANESESQLQDTSKSITDWYVAHPVVRVQPNTCNGQVPGPNNNTAGPNGVTTGSDAGTYYLSQYSPADTEQVANRLDQLQKLLIKDGVKVK